MVIALDQKEWHTWLLRADVHMSKVSGAGGWFQADARNCTVRLNK